TGLDPAELRVVHVERAELDLAARAGLVDGGRRAVGVDDTDGDHAVDAGVLQQRRLDGLGDRGRVADAGRRQRQLGRLADAGGDAVADALAPRLGVGRAGQGVDAQHVLDALLGEVLPARLAGQALVGTGVAQRAYVLRRLRAAGVVQEHGGPAA